MTLNDTWSFDLRAQQWKLIDTKSTTGTIPALRGHCAVVFNNVLYVFGGNLVQHLFNDKLYALDLGTCQSDLPNF